MAQAGEACVTRRHSTHVVVVVVDVSVACCTLYEYSYVVVDVGVSPPHWCRLASRRAIPRVPSRVFCHVRVRVIVVVFVVIVV